MPHNDMNGTMQRLFVAVELPAAIRLFLAKRQRGLHGVRWSTPGNLHLTIRFIGEVSPERHAAVKAGLRTVRADAFSLQVNGLGFFDKSPQAVPWAGLAPSAGLLELKRQVDGALERYAGILTGDEPFTPHITLGRMKRADKEALQSFTNKSDATLAAAFMAESFTLFRSVRTPGGAVHTAEERYPLAVAAFG